MANKSCLFFSVCSPLFFSNVTIRRSVFGHFISVKVVGWWLSVSGLLV